MTLYYAGIGSRQTPPDVLDKFTTLAQVLEEKGYVLRSGGAEGADSSFAEGAITKEIYRPSMIKGEIGKRAMEIARQHHPAWHKCNEYVRKLHGRNAMIILGEELNTPVEMVICWTVNGETIGGTGLGISIAQSNSIPVINFGNPFQSQLEVFSMMT